MDEAGGLYGWGSNASMQLSHEEEFSKVRSPLLCSYSPIKITRNLGSSAVTHLAAGSDFSVVVTTNSADGSCEVFSFGNNLKGQLGLGRVQHVKDVTKVASLSNFVVRD